MTIHTCKSASILCFIKKIFYTHNSKTKKKRVKNNGQERDDVRRASLEVDNLFTKSRDV